MSANRHRATSQLQLLSDPDWQHWAPAMATSTESPVCSRRRAILWSLVGRKQGRGEERWRGEWRSVRPGSLRFRGWGAGSSLRVPQRKNGWAARWNSLSGAVLLFLHNLHVLLLLDHLLLLLPHLQSWRGWLFLQLFSLLMMREARECSVFSKQSEQGLVQIKLPLHQRQET